MGKAKKYYAVLKGYEPGVYDSWTDCQKQVNGFSGAEFKSYTSREEALTAFNTNELDVEIEPTYKPSSKESISVDVGTHGNPGIMEYRLVWSDTGEEIYHSKEYPVGTNNLGEFLAIVHAIGYVRKENLDIDIYSDSQTALTWVKKKQYKTSLERNKDTELLFKHLDRAISYLRNNEPYAKLHKWNTVLHGEIKADFGRK